MDTFTTAPMGIGVPERQPSQAIPESYQRTPLDLRKRYRKVLLALGITEVILGATLIFLVIATLTVARGPNYYYGGQVYCFFGDFLTYVGIGIWSGAFGLLSGVLGIVIKIKKSTSMYVGNMTVAIINAHFSCVGVVLSSLAARFSVCMEILRTLHIVIACVCFVMMSMTITHSVICCSRICCDDGYDIQEQISSLYQQNTYQQPRYGMGTNNQLMVISEPGIAQEPRQLPLDQITAPLLRNQGLGQIRDPEQTDGARIREQVVKQVQEIRQERLPLESKVDRSISETMSPS